MSAEKKTELINPKRQPLTPEKLRELSGLNLSSLTKYAGLSRILPYSKNSQKPAKRNQLMVLEQNVMLPIEKLYICVNLQQQVLSILGVLTVKN